MRLTFGVFLGVLFIFGGVALEGGSLRSVIHLTSLLITVGGAFAGLIIAYPTKTVIHSMRIALLGEISTKSAYIDASRVFKSFGDLSVLSGIIGMLVGCLHVLTNLSNPDQIGPGVMVGLGCLFCTLMLKLFICNPMRDSFTAKAFPSVETPAMAAGQTI
jgi:flagellar motor component MotA